MKRSLRICDRREAIKTAVMLPIRDVILVAGKDTDISGDKRGKISF